LTTDDGRIWYEVFGAGGPTLVLIHDGMAHSEVWDEQVAALAGEYRVVRYDRRGYGRSDPPTEPYFDPDDLKTLLAHLEIDRAVLIGSSSGGGICLDYTLRHPDRVEALILSGAVVSGMGYSSHFSHRNFGNLSGDPEEQIRGWLEDEFLIARGNDGARVRLRDLLTAFPQNLDLQKYRLRREPLEPALPRLGEIAVPVLLITGEFDIPDVHAHAGAIEAGVVGARRIVLDDCGHLSYVERPAEFAGAVREFLSMVSFPPAEQPEGRESHGATETAVAPGVPSAPAPWGTFSRGFCRTPHSDLYYEVMGKGEPLILMHGGLIDHRMWDDQFALLAGRFRVVRYDIGTNGLSRSRAPGGRTYEDLAALMDHLGIDRAHLMGLSLGGRVAIDFAVAYPERVHKVVLAAPGMSGYQFDSPEAQQYRQRIFQVWMAGDWEGVVEEFMRAWTDGPQREPDDVDPAMRERVRRMGDNCIRIHLVIGDGLELDPPAVGRLGEIRAPTLVVAGDLDMPGIHEIVRLVDEQVPGSRKTVLEGAAHMVNMEKAEQFNRLVLEFLAEGE
jgi:pimeloyl-ACP methyl ester carboxylesterase